MSKPLIIAGPCAAESREQVLTTALLLKDAGISVFRAGVWKPRTEPDNFEGVGEPALQWLAEAEKQTGLSVATEVATREHVCLALTHGIRTLWVGARTTTNPFLVQQIADALTDYLACSQDDITVLVKNPVSPDLRLWKGAIERFRNAGVQHVVAVHRGFQTGQPSPYRNAPVWSIPFALKLAMPDIPLLLDPSHLTGKAEWVSELARQAVVLGYNGLMVEVHPHPNEALTDREQQLTPDELRDMLAQLHFRTGHTTDSTSPAGHTTDSYLPSDHDENMLFALRQQLDETDDTLFLLLLQRMQISRQIGEYKRNHNLPVLQEKRYAEVLDKRLAWARNNGLDEDIIRRILDAIHEESCRWQL